jgi:AraC family ethanolamine operon transcriptional activator
MTRIIFRDFDEFAAAIGGIAGQFVPTARSETDWWVRRASVRRVSLQLVQIGGATTFIGDGADNTITLGIPISESTPMRVDGEPLKNNSFLLVRAGQPFTFGAGHATLWGGIIVPLDHELIAPELLQVLNTKVFGGRRSALTQTQISHIARARLLISRLCADDDTVEFRDAAAECAAEEEIMMVAARTIEESGWSEHRNIGRPRFSRSRVLHKALELIEASSGRPLLIQDLCRATQVSERTLRNVFQEYFNVGPMRLLKVRQLYEIRAALRAAERSEQTVSDIAARFGVWDFSSFARHYRALYDETPSYTLRSAAARDPAFAISKTWIRYATQKFSAET